MAAVVIIVGGRGLLIEVPVVVISLTKVNYRCVAITLTFLLSSCTQAARWSTSVIKVGVVYIGVHILRCLKQELV